MDTTVVCVRINENTLFLTADRLGRNLKPRADPDEFPREIIRLQMRNLSGPEFYAAVEDYYEPQGDEERQKVIYLRKMDTLLCFSGDSQIRLGFENYVSDLNLFAIFS